MERSGAWTPLVIADIALEDTARQFSKVTVPVDIPVVESESFSRCVLSAILRIVSLFHFSSWMDVWWHRVIYIYISWLTKEVKPLFAFTRHLHSHKVPIQSSYPVAPCLHCTGYSFFLFTNIL